MAATHQPMEELVSEGGFREDLYFRLRVVEIYVPSLRDRKADIPLLAQHLLGRIRRETGATVGRSRTMRWPVLRSTIGPVTCANSKTR